MFKPYSTHCSRQGLSLIEVIAATALLSTLLVGVLVAHSKHSRLILRDEQRLLAIEATDELIAGWMRDGVLIPRFATGRIPNTDLAWATQIANRQHADQLGIEIVRLEVRHAAAANSVPIISIELAAPDSRIGQTDATE